MSAFVVVIILVDALLLGALFYFVRNMVNRKLVQLEDVFEERQIIRKLKEEVSEALDATIRDNQTLLQKVRTLAAEAEQEVLAGKQQLREEMQALTKNMSAEIEEPLVEVNLRFAAVEKASKRAETERQLLNRSIQRAEQLIQFLNKDLPYEEIVKEIQEKKYSDARFLMAKGWTADKVGKELGLSASEVQILARS